jgi:hypothetical protein
MIHLISTHALMFRNPENQDQVAHVRPSATPQAVPDWVKDDPYFAMCKKSKSIREVRLVEEDENEEAEEAEEAEDKDDAAEEVGTPATPAKKRAARKSTKPETTNTAAPDDNTGLQK